MSGDPVSDVLLRAADRLEQPGVWAQGTDVRDERDCMITALSDIADGDVLQAAVARLRECLTVSILKYNDTPGRTAAEVVTALRQAAQLKETE